jgi:N utilization substance protein B
VSENGGSSRTRARRRAVDVLFEADQRGLPIAALGVERLRPEPGSHAERAAGAGKPDYATVIVQGVADHLEEIDETLSTYSQGWTLARMPAVDRAIARMGAWEILHGGDVPDAVVLSQAADLAGELSTDSSANFLSGLLGRVATMKAYG